MSMKTPRGFTLIELMIVLAILGILFALVVGQGGCLVGCNDSYSDGERVGVVTKLSHKGWQYKTWEGEMNLGGLASNSEGHLQANIWAFTITEEDEANLKLIQDAQRSQKPIIIRYKQWMVRPKCQTDSGYIVQSAEFVKAETPGKK